MAGESPHIPADARFNIEHEREGGCQELEFQLLWRRAAGKSASRAASNRPFKQQSPDAS